MNIHELDSYNLGDAVKFNDKLNPRIWGADEKMRPEVREQLLKIADDFREFLGIDVEVKDITVSGSNAAYTYTPHSDIDLHLVVDLPQADSNQVYRELFDAKKYAYNEQHDIKIGGYDVELYVQDANKKHHSQGIYSLTNDNWVSVPKRRRPDVDDISVKSKFEDLGHRIESAIASRDYEKISAMADKLKDYRQAGLDAHGEFGPENLAFKILRKQGLIQKLYDARNAAKDELLSLDERRKKKKRKSVRYGYGGYWYPGYAYAGQDHPAGSEGGDGGGGDGGGESIREDAGMTWDGVNPTTDMFTSEDATMTWDGVNPSTAMFTTETENRTDEEILRDFVNFCVKELKIEHMPRVKLRKDPQWPAMHKTFGRYNDENKTLEVAWGQRHIMDVLRTVAHELTHKHQHEREGERMGPDAGETGSPYENEANARAGVLMRDYGRLHPEYFTAGQAHDLQADHLKETAPIGPEWRSWQFADMAADPDHAWKQQVRQLAQIYQTNPFILAQLAQEKGAGSAEAAAYDHMLNPQGRIPLPHGANVKESASGYIPTRAQAKDPRFSMALTVDIKPGQVGKEANKLKLKTDRQGHPQIARANGLFENLYKEYKRYKADEDYSPDEPPGPESKPTMPAGTLRVDVSDVYDWYKLGQHIANMKGLGQHDFGKGPPSTIISFGDEDEEHKFIKDLEATGLDVTDIDPVDPKQPPGMKKVKTDPTYNVDEAIQAPVSKNRDAEQYYNFIVGKARLGRPLTRAEQDYVKMYQMYRQQKLAEVSADRLQRYLRRAGQQVDRRQERMAQARERLNKGYEIYDAEDPTRIVHRFEADTPQEARRYYEQYNADYDSDRDFDLQLRRATGLEENLNELALKSTLPVTQTMDHPGKQVYAMKTQSGEYRIVFNIFDKDEDSTELGLDILLLGQDSDGSWSQWNTNVGEKQVAQIFSTIAQLAVKLIRSRPEIDEIEIKGADPQRSRIYSRLMQQNVGSLLPGWKLGGEGLVRGKPQQAVAESKIKLSTDPNWYGAEVGDYTSSGPVVNVPADRLVGFEPDDKMDQPASKANVEKIVAGLKQGAKLPPLLVRKYKNGYQVLDGHHRFWAYKLLGIKAIPAQVVPDEDIKELVESEELDEVNMSPGALEKFATSDAAKGIRAGFEAELIFRDTQGSSDDIDPEPDYDADERAYSIAQVIEFFTMDEYGYGLSDRERNRLEEQLDETYMNWRDDQIISDFRNDAEDLIREKLLEETPLSERIHLYLTDSEQMSDKEADRIIAAGVDAPRFNTSKEQQAYAAENPYYQAYLDAVDAAELELDESVEYSVSQQDGYWDEALDDYRDDWSGDDDSFFSDVGLRWMSDVANEFGLDWPVWNMDSDRNNGSRSWEDIGSELQAVVDMPVVVSDNYHSTRRRPGQWIIEPDGSLSPDDQSEEAGLEIVSPPMPLLTAIEKLRQVTDWANDPNGGNAYTNGTTGLHMGVSLPRFTSEDADSDAGIDYVKLILFMGDKYVQQQFGREANNFCASALGKLQQNIKGKKSDPAGVIELLRHGLTELAYRELQKGVGTSKYTSAHIQDGYIEFRSPGGDWLAKSDEEIGILENTMLRFARAMAIAGDPSADRKEYAKKLYKLVTQDNEQYADQLRLFSEFSAGTINKEQLKKQWADSVLRKEIPSTGQEEYEVYDANKSRSPEGVIETFYARNYNDAYEQYTKKYVNDPRWTQTDIRIKQPWFDVFDDTGKVVVTMRARDGDTATDRAQYEFGQRWTDAWRVYRRPDESPEPEKKLSPRAQVAKRITTKPKTATQYNYDIVDQRTVELRVVDQFRAETPQEAERVYSAWLKSKDLPDDTANYGYRKNEQAADDQRDSVDIQRRLGVQDIDTDVAQNFTPDYSAYERNSDRIDAIRAQQRQAPDATQRSGSWSIYDVTLGREITRMDNVPWQQANDRANELEQSTGHDMSVRGLSESIDPISGAGAVPPRQDPKSIGKKSVTPAEKVFKNPVKGQPYRSAIGQAITQRDLENMTQQIQVARKLGDSVMEMEDTPPEVLRALDQAAQKNGYRNWADVKANPRSNSAVMTVAKLANTIMKTTGPHHEKLFYKNKTDVDENFADGKVKGKSRPGRVKRAGASCAGSVTSLRARAKNSSGEKAKMYHWCANMKAGRKK